MAPVARHVRAITGEGDGATPLHRFGVVRHIADLYDRYAVHRPELIRQWAGARIAGGQPAGVVSGSARQAWQAELWRRLRARVGVPSPAERLDAAATALRADPALSGLPERLAVFGLTTLPPSFLDVLGAIAAHRAVHLFLLHPSGALWDEVRRLAPHPPRPCPRRSDPSIDAAHHPLLASWARDAREMQLVLTAGEPATDDHWPVLDDGREATVLSSLQSDVRANRQPPGRAGGAPRVVVDAEDRSLQVHSCHGRARQVEVIRDVVLHLLEDDPTLEPRDILVMCPDIETYAPLIHAAFGAGGPTVAETGDGEHGVPRLEVSLADRSLRQTNPMLAAAAQLLELARGRVTATEVLDFAGREPVRTRFGFDDDELGQIQEWLSASGTRWGLDGNHRERWGLGGLEANTWSAGLDRLALGVAMAEEDQRLVGATLPVDDVGSNSVELVGRFVEFVHRLAGVIVAMQEPQPIGSWMDTLLHATEQLAEARPADSWQVEQLRRTLERTSDEAGAARALLTLGEVTDLLADRLRGQPTRANFRTGRLTMCTLVPMRSVPHRVVCLLGLDDGAFPRAIGRDGDDLLLDDPHVGDRDQRSEDRQLLLDALLAATEHLIITYSGRDVRTNQSRPPAVPVAELLDVVDRSVTFARDGVPDPMLSARSQLVVQHPLQPFDRRCFVPEGLWPRQPWSFDPVGLGGARALGSSRHPVRTFLTRPLGDRPGPAIELADLVRFVEHPVRSFLRERLGVSARDREDDIQDGIPVELEPLEKWGVGDRMLRALLNGAEPSETEAAERARGLLPPGVLADDVLRDVTTKVLSISNAAAAIRPSRAVGTSREIRVGLPDGREVLGTVADVWDEMVLTAHYSRLAAKHRLAAWVRFVALTASWPELDVSACTLGQGDRGGVAVAQLSSLGPDPATREREARRHLLDLVDLYDRGMREPLPLYCKTSAAYAVARWHGGSPLEGLDAARKEWESRFGEQSEPEHLLLLDGSRPVEDLNAALALADECGEGWDQDEPTRFGRLALRLWTEVLRRERLSTHE